MQGPPWWLSSPGWGILAPPPPHPHCWSHNLSQHKKNNRIIPCCHGYKEQGVTDSCHIQVGGSWLLPHNTHTADSHTTCHITHTQSNNMLTWIQRTRSYWQLSCPGWGILPPPKPPTHCWSHNCCITCTHTVMTHCHGYRKHRVTYWQLSCPGRGILALPPSKLHCWSQSVTSYTHTHQVET